MTQPIPVTAQASVAVMAFDVGNSKTDVALVTRDGAVLATVRGPTASHQQVGADRAFATLVGLAESAALKAGLAPAQRPLAELAVVGAAGADYPTDIRLLTRVLARTGLAADGLVVNDCDIGLRAGSARSWGICVVCGSGMNCLGVGPDGRAARFDALGDISGDQGGGGWVGLAGLAAAVRSEDGRGPATVLARTVPAYFGLARPRSLTVALYRGRIEQDRLLEIAPLVFEAAGLGDAVARAIVDRQADEIVAWAAAAIRRLRLQRRDPDVVLAGGVFQTEDRAFFERIAAAITALAPAARVSRLAVPPVLGAALLGFDRLAGQGAPPDVEDRLRAELTVERLVGATIRP